MIRQDKLMVKAGQRIPRDVAQQLARLEIFPLVVGLDLRGAYEAGTVFRREALAVDDTVGRGQIAPAWRGGPPPPPPLSGPPQESSRPPPPQAPPHAVEVALAAQCPPQRA